MTRALVSVSQILLFSVLLLTPLDGESVLNFPRIAFEPNTFTGLAFVNPNAGPATVVLSVYGANGLPATAPGFQNPAELIIPAKQQVARLLVELFGGPLPPEFVGWIQAKSESSDITGFFLYLDSSVNLLDGADLPQSGDVILFHSAQSEGAFAAEMNVINPNRTGTSLNVELIRPGLETLTTVTPLNLPAKGLTRLRPEQLFGIGNSPEGSYLVVRGSGRIAGFELVRTSARDLFGLNARSDRERLSRLFIPQFAVLGPWTTQLTLVNISDENIILTVSALTAEGELWASGAVQQNPVVRALNAGQSFTGDVAEVFGFGGEETRIGWLKVASTSASVQGFVSYGVPGTGSIAAVAAQSEGRTEFLFSHIATTLGYFTGVALLNPGTLAANFRVLAFTPEGVQIGRFNGVLRGGERLSKVVEELIPQAAGRSGGFVWVKSDLPLYATSLFGTERVLANIPPQPAPASFVPDLGQPQPRIQPRVAVVQPGRSLQFSSEGFQKAVSWSVDGETGGNSALGVIDDSGRYRAPETLSQPRALEISASAEMESAGASVDLLRKEDLVSGLGTIQSVAFLASLQRLYTAEVSGFGTLETPSSRGVADTDGSRVFSSFPERFEVRSYPDEFIAKMIPFISSTGQEFLLLAGRQSGRIFRLNPASGDSVTVIQGLTEPTALVFDPSNGYLLVADRDVIRSYSPRVLEAGLTTTLQTDAPRERGLRQLAEGFTNLVGLTVDACTGDLYASEAAGRLLAVDRISGEKREIDSGRRLSSLLGIYRTGVPCPAGFHLLATEPENARVHLFVPSSDLDTVWLEGSRVSDLALLPEENPTDLPSSILLGQAPVSAPEGGSLSLVSVPDLYEPPGDVSLPPIPSRDDPVGDTFGPAGPQYDIVNVDAYRRVGTLVVTVELSREFEILTPDSEGGELTIGIEFDIDQNPATGVESVINLLTPFRSDLGVEYGVETELDPASGTVPVYLLTAPGQGDVVARVPIQVGTRSLTVSIPTGEIELDSCVDFVVEAGYYDRFDQLFATDIAPNLGHYTVCLP